MGLTITFLWALLFLTFSQAAFLRRLECNRSDNALIDPIFQPLSLYGYLTPKPDNTTTLSLKLLGEYESHNCDAIGGANAQITLDAKVLGRSVVSDEHRLESHGACPERSPLDYPRSDSRTYAIYKASYSLDHIYRMNTLAATIRLRLNGTDISCVATNITPYIGSVASRALRTIPLFIMIVTGVITGTLRMCRSRGRSIFRYELADASRDPAESYLPGIGHYLQYIQFIFLTGCLSLSYPGFFRASTGELAWSSLIFKNWPVTHRFTYPGVEDNIYAFNATYGLEEMSQFLGATALSDLWTNAVVNLSLVVLGAIVTLQLVWLFKWTWQLLPTRKSSSMIDLRTEFVSHVQHTGWSVARIILDYFLHPIVTFSLYQPLIAKWFPIYRTFLAVAFVSSLAVSMAYIVRYLTKTDRQRHFFHKGSFPRRSSRDWLSDTLYGVPFIRGLAIGALQFSGLGQLLALMACELFILACLHWNRRKERIWRHICLSTVRLIILAMSCAFLPRAGLHEGKKALISYFIISLHALVLFTGFIIDCLYDPARFALFKLGILDSGPTDLGPQSHEAPVFGINQLSRRSTRRVSFARLPALSPVEISIPYTQRPASPRRPSVLSDLPTRHKHPSIFQAPRSDTTSIPSAWSMVSPSSPSQSETTDSHGSSMESVELEALDLDDTMREKVDYSFRESDQYYGRPPTAPPTFQRIQQGSAESSTATKGHGKRLWKWRRGQKKEKGFEVIRPNRPAS